MAAQPKEVVEKILASLGFPTTIETHELEEGLLLDVKTDDAGRLIGRQGQTLADLQYLTNRILFQQDQNSPKVTVDVGGYRLQARDALVKKAFQALRKMCAERAIAFSEVDLRWGITQDQAERGEGVIDLNF